MPQARTIAEVIAGEAVHGTREQRYADMLGIASVISNRSTVTGVPADSIISAPSQFDAYGKSLPPGTSAYTGLAQQAWDQVQTTGPVHPGTFYAAPSAVKNLPSGLAPVTATTGHQYFMDPAARAIKTAVGTIKPSVDAVAGLVQRTVGAVTDAVGGLLPDSAPAPVSRPSQGLGMAALAPNGLLGTQSNISYSNQNSQRNQKPDARFESALSGAVRGYFGPDYSVDVTSGKGRLAGKKGNANHPYGFAADFDVVNNKTGQRVGQSQMEDFGAYAASKGFTGVGIGPGYMAPGRMHLDMAHTSPTAWGDRNTASTMTPGVNDAIENAGRTGAPVHGMGLPGPGAPTPTSRPADPGTVSRGYAQAAQTMGKAGVRGLGATQQFSAPVEKVDRAPIGPASLPPDRPMPSGPLSMANIGSLPPDRPMPTGPVNLGPTTAELAAAYKEMAKPNTFGSIALGTPPATPQVAPLQAPAPVQAPLQPPVQQPIAQPVRAPVQAPVQTTERLAPVNSFTAGDIYGGQVGSALASGGNTVSRDALGRTSVTNKHGVTTVSMPDGKQAATTSIGTPSAPSNGLLGGMTGQKMGGMVKGGLGAVAGAQIGGLLGPVGAVLGGYVGSQLAQGKNPLGALTNAGTGKGLGYFPGAPAPSKKSYKDMADVNFAGFGSGNRASAAEANRGGRGVTAGGVGLW